MSGGSMDYLYCKVQDASFREHTPERKALRLHLNKLAKALQAVEWDDSGDGADNEAELIREAIGDRDILEASIQAAKEAHKDLGDQLARVEASWLSKEMQTPAKGFPALREDTWEPRIGDVVKWKGCRRTCTVETVKAGPTRSWTLIKERKGDRRTYVVKDVSELTPYGLEEDEE